MKKLVKYKLYFKKRRHAATKSLRYKGVLDKLAYES
jgi:hypothetical protein